MKEEFDSIELIEKSSCGMWINLLTNTLQKMTLRQFSSYMNMVNTKDLDLKKDMNF